MAFLFRGRSRGKSSGAAAEVQFKAEFETIFAAAPMGIVVSNERGLIVHANLAMEQFLRYSRNELIGVALSSLTHAADRATDQACCEKLCRGEFDKYQLDQRYVRKDGVTAWGRVVVSLVCMSQGAGVYVLGMVEDIGDERATREQLDVSRRQLEDANRRLALYLERAPLACIAWGTDQIVRAWNPAAEEMFGYTAAETIGRNVYELTATPEGLAAIAEVRARAPADREFNEILTIENRRKDGSRLKCEWHFSVMINREESSNGVIAFGLDVTQRERGEQERRLLEVNLRQAQKMQSLGTLAGGIAHDFNNILLAISGNARLAMQELPQDSAVQVSLAEIDKASVRASGIVNQILMFSRREEESQQAPLNLQEIIGESLNLLRAILPARIAIRTRLDPAAPTVLGDASQIHQVLLNLATNAAHAMDAQGGPLDIELEKIEVDAGLARESVDLRPGPYARISFRDTGVGMSAQLIERIFDPFFTTKPRGQGTGLGLSVVHGIMRSHGGAITLQSIEGAGSVFRIYLPAAPQSAAVTPSLPIAPGRGNGQHILYVDDEEPLVYLLSRTLQRLGYRVTGFTDPREALEALRADPASFDAVVTDLSMPGLSGHELAQAVLKIRPELPVVLTSGYVRNEDRELAISAGVREVVLKPDTVQALGEILHRLLHEQAAAE